MADSFQLNIPSNLDFQTYLTITHLARTLADGYDRKDPSRLLAVLAPNLTVDYSLVVPAWGLKPFTREAFTALWLDEFHLGVKSMFTQHLLGIPYFLAVSVSDITAEFQILASHARKASEEERKVAEAKGVDIMVEETSDGRAWFRLKMANVEGEGWKICQVRPEVIYHTGDFLGIGRPDGEADGKESTAGTGA